MSVGWIASFACDEKLFSLLEINSCAHETKTYQATHFAARLSIQKEQLQLTVEDYYSCLTDPRAFRSKMGHLASLANR